MAHYRRNAQRAARRRFRSRRDQAIFVRQMGAEANFHDATSPAGAQGPAQFMPGTARSVGLRNPRDPDQAYDAAARLMDRYLRQYNGDWRKALAAYNAGPGAVQRYGGPPPFRETQNYVQKILRGGSARADVTRRSRGRGGSVTTTETTTEPVQVSGGDQRLLLYQYLQERHKPDALLNLGLQMRAVEEATPQFATQTTTRTTRTPGGRRRRSSRGGTTGPIRGPIIGTPHAGTHTLGNWQSDNAVDVRLRRGTPLPAVASGVVTKVSRRPDGGGRFAGSSVTIRTANNEYFYAHLADVNVRPGQRVRRGQIIGRSGVANGVPHLHLGRRRGDPRRVVAS